jgi:xylulokinase
VGLTLIKEFLIGTDIGTSGTKSVLVDLKGRVLETALVEYTIESPRSLWAEQWPDIWLDAAKSTIRDVVKKSKVDPNKIAGICISGLYGGSGVPCDKDMQPVRPCIIWMDRRATHEYQWVVDNIGIDRLFSITGNGADPYFGFTKMLWIKNHEPENWARIKMFLPPNFYVIHRLTGNIAIDYSSAGNIGGIFDMRSMAWSNELMDEMGIPESMMPSNIVSSSDIVGHLTSAMAGEMGLVPGIPIIAGAIDCLSATLSAGVLEPGQHVAVIGTSINWGLVHEDFPTDPKLVTMPYIKEPKEKRYTYGGASTAGALPRWFRDNFAILEKQAEELTGESSYFKLDQEAAEISVGSDGLIVLPYFMGERTPIWDTNARGTIFGLTLHHTKAHIYKAILESVAYALRHIIETSGKEFDENSVCVIVGGATKSSLWKQIFADVIGIPIVCPTGNIEAPLGDALLAGVATGVLKDFTVIKDWINFEDRVTPNKDGHLIYSKYFEQYKQLYLSLAENMKSLVKLTEQISSNEIQ